MEQLLHDFSPGLFFIQALILVVLIVLMRKFAWKPILDSLDERETEIKSAIEAAQQAREEMAQLSSDNERLIQEAKEEQSRILKEAQATANNVIAEAKELDLSLLPQKPAGKGKRVKDETFEARVDEMIGKRDAVAKELDIDASLLISRAVLESLAANEVKPEGVLMKWQQELLQY